VNILVEIRQFEQQCKKLHSSIKESRQEVYGEKETKEKNIP
jgi:hypothetical protein